MRVLVGLATLLAACYSPSAAVGVPCSSTGECPSGQHCDHTINPPMCAAADARPVDAPPDAPPTCMTDANCAAAAPICDLVTSTCRGCIADAECGVDVCVEYLGACVNDNNALYIAPNGTNSGECTKAAPCQTVNFAVGLVAPNRRTIAVADGTYSVAVNIPAGINANTLTLSGTDRDPAGAVFTAGIDTANSMKEILIEGVTVRNSGNRAIENRGTLTVSRVALTGSNIGLSTVNGNTLRIVDSQIHGNVTYGVDVSQTTTEILRSVVYDNTSGGIDVNDAATTIESSIINNNGNVFAASFGGVRYQNLNGKPQVFRFNTLVYNAAVLGAPGVQCYEPVPLDSSIVVDSSPGSSIGMQCQATYSLFSFGPPDGMGNMMSDPVFVGQGDFHITATSPARDAANPLTIVNRDVDGEVRPQGMARDIGADEIP